MANSQGWFMTLRLSAATSRSLYGGRTPPSQCNGRTRFEIGPGGGKSRACHNIGFSCARPDARQGRLGAGSDAAREPSAGSSSPFLTGFSPIACFSSGESAQADARAAQPQPFALEDGPPKCMTLREMSRCANRLACSLATIVLVQTGAFASRPWLVPASAAEPTQSTGVVLLARRESALDVTGAVGDAEVDSAGVDIAASRNLGSISERPAPKIPRPPLHPKGTLDPQLLRLDLARNFRDIELCRFKVAAASGLPVTALSAGQISLHFTVLPSGGTRDTLVFETTQTDLALMKCVRRRMNAWRFSQPRGGPVSLAYDYTFPTLGSAAGPRAATSGRTPARRR